MSTLPLTPRQEQLWRFIASCNRSPTYDEMAKALGYSCRGARITQLVQSLERKGFVARQSYAARSIVAINPNDLKRFPTEALQAELSSRLAA